MPANSINFVTQLIYGDMGASELGSSAHIPASGFNHIRWTLQHLPNSVTSTVTGQEFLTHHLDYMLQSYQEWRSKYFLPPLRPWDGQDMFPGIGTPVGPTLPTNLNGSPFPGAWTENDLGSALRTYYNSMRHFSSSGDSTEMNADEIKAPYSYRYWEFLKWMSDLRKRLNGQPVLPVSITYDRDGTILTEKAFTDVFYDVHHVWHPNGVGLGWTTATPYFRTSVGQHRRKKEISRTQVGSEFFAFHRDHLEIFDRWLTRTGQVLIESWNTCNHDTSGSSALPSGVDIDTSFLFLGAGIPTVDWTTNPPTVDLNPAHATYWNGDLSEFTNLGLMGQFFATDNNDFQGTTSTQSGNGSFIPVTGASDRGYHGIGHVTNGDLIEPVTNNHVPRFFAWHGYIDDLWTKRRPDFNAFEFLLSNNATYPEPQVLTILRDLNTNTDTIEPNNAIAGIDRANGQGTLKVKFNVRTDPFSRDLELVLRCDVLRENVSNIPVISIIRNITLPSAQQNTDIIEQFVFDGTPGTEDSLNEGPFVADNLLFPPVDPKDTGFKNSLIRITGYLTCNRMADGSLPTVSGTISSSGTSLTGSGTSFSTQFNQGDLIRSNGQVRTIALINSDTSITLLDAFDSNLPSGTSYERLDGFDFEKIIDLPLIQEKQAPEITTYLDRSSFSKDQVDAIATGGQSLFSSSFYVILQDRTSRAANISWPAEVEPKMRNLIAPPVYGAGLYSDTAHKPSVTLVDLSNNTVLGVSVNVGSPSLENPSQHPSIPQRITYACDVTFTNTNAFNGMVAGDTRELKLVITAVDRAGNEITDDTKRVRLQINANPYMLDGATSWLSVDTRVFKIQQGQARFGVSSWTDPNVFIQQVITNFRNGNGTAGGETFDLLPQGQSTSVLEYSTSVNGVNYYNFALSKMRLQSQTGANNVRASFRLFRWGTANVEFDSTLAYRSTTGGIPLLGRTSTNGLASIPFFADPRVSTSSSMTTQPDAPNLINFPSSGGGEVTSFFGAYLDINQSTNRFPDTFTGDGGFSGTLHSIRNLLLGHHQCMVVEIAYSADPTVNGATPGTSDNLSQRNLLIVQTANPGDEITRTVQHLFDIDLTRKRKRVLKDPDRPVITTHGGHGHDIDHSNEVMEENGDDSILENKHLNPDANCCDIIEVLPPFPNLTVDHENHNHLDSGWIADFPKALEHFMVRAHKNEENRNLWRFDDVHWKPGTGLDELAFFWNNLPKESIVDVYLPGIPVTEIFNYRSLRHAPRTVEIVNENTLRLKVADVTYLPIPPFYGENLAGLITVQLPKGIKKGQRFKVDVMQIRTDEAKTLGGFQLNIQVEKAYEIVEQERTWLELFHQRLSLIPKDNRWFPIVKKQVDFTRERAIGLVGLANEEDPLDEPRIWEDPTINQKGKRIKIILDKIQILDDQEPFFKGKGEFRFYSKVYSSDNGGVSMKNKFPEDGCYKLSDKPGKNEVIINEVIFNDFVEDNLFVQIGGLELDTFDPDDRLCTYKRLFNGDIETWIGAYANHNGDVNPENLGAWKVWYSIEYSG